MAQLGDTELPTAIQGAIAKGKRYTLRIYRRGPKRDQDEETSRRIQVGHLKHIFALKERGVLLVNGPLVDDDDIRGIGIFDIEDIEEVRRIDSQDPAVVAGRLTVEVHPWFGQPGDGLR
jgi:uncharacterized protein YciI